MHTSRPRNLLKEALCSARSDRRKTVGPTADLHAFMTWCLIKYRDKCIIINTITTVNTYTVV
jgi:hypothetical protein